MRYRSRYSSNLTDNITAIATIGFTILIIICCVGEAFIKNGNKEVITVTILNTEAKIKSGDKSETYLVSVKHEDGTLEVLESSDSYIQGKFNSADVYFTLKNSEGKKFRLTVVGQRNYFLSWNRNILAVEGPIE